MAMVGNPYLFHVLLVVSPEDDDEDEVDDDDADDGDEHVHILDEFRAEVVKDGGEVDGVGRNGPVRGEERQMRRAHSRLVPSRVVFADLRTHG